jgi:glycosyltransferase involved in cell wall biosynthesis
MKITTILPVSRTSYLDRVLDSLKNQTYKPNNLIVIFDGYDKDYVTVRNKVVELDFDNVLCVPSLNQRAAFTIAERRNHIVNIHNQARELIGDCDWVFSIEDDGVLPHDALAKLVKNVKKHKDTGMFTGVELGRWGMPYVGAWKLDDVFEPKVSKSMDNKTEEGGVEEIDGCGLYCALIRADKYKEHIFYTRNGLGPDVNLGLFLRQQGFMNYIDWSIHVTHLTYDRGMEKEIPATTKSNSITLTLRSGSTWEARSN